MAELASSARRASNSQTMAGLARFGLAARAFVYIVIGWLAVQIARGHGSHEANQRGALADIAKHSYGVALLWILGIGFAAYAVWRLSEAAFGTAADGTKAGPRVRSLVRGIVYAALSVTTFSFIAGTSKQGQSQQQATLTARVMRHAYGRWLVGLVGLIGLIVVVVGLGMVVEGITKKFEKQLLMHELTGSLGVELTMSQAGRDQGDCGRGGSLCGATGLTRSGCVRRCRPAVRGRGVGARRGTRRGCN